MARRAPPRGEADGRGAASPLGDGDRGRAGGPPHKARYNGAAGGLHLGGGGRPGARGWRRFPSAGTTWPRPGSSNKAPALHSTEEPASPIPDTATPPVPAFSPPTPPRWRLPPPATLRSRRRASPSGRGRPSATHRPPPFPPPAPAPPSGAAGGGPGGPSAAASLPPDTEPVSPSALAGEEHPGNAQPDMGPAAAQPPPPPAAPPAARR